jgi:large subunit ribosomal protein L24
MSLISSRKPSKQRKALANAPLHVRQRLVSAHLSASLRKQIGKRSLPLRKGDEVRVMRGQYTGAVGKVEEVDLKQLKIYVENVKRKKASGQEAAVAMHPSKLMITNLVMEDKERKFLAERKGSKPSKPAEHKGPSPSAKVVKK